MAHSPAREGRTAVIEGTFVLPTWTFEDSPLYAETPFDPTVYSELLPAARESIGRANLVTVVAVDSASMVVQALRAASLPRKWVERTGQAWGKAWDVPSYSARYSAWLGALAARPLEEIMREAEPLGRLGEA